MYRSRRAVVMMKLRAIERRRGLQLPFLYLYSTYMHAEYVNVARLCRRRAARNLPCYCRQDVINHLIMPSASRFHQRRTRHRFMSLSPVTLFIFRDAAPLFSLPDPRK